MIPTIQQEAALKEISAWLKDPHDPVYVLAGYAGTGKTTLIKKIVEDLNVRTYFCAFTGKAALAMRERGVHNAQTIHSMIYKHVKKKLAIRKLEELSIDFNLATSPMEKKKIQDEIDELNYLLSNPEFIINITSEAYQAPLIVVDEFSMLTEKLVEDLISFGKKILFIGDPGQLDPVDKENKGAKCPLKPNIFLTEVVRQALESPIIRAATSVREHGRIIGVENSSEFAALRRPPSIEVLRSADQVICGLNSSRREINASFISKVDPGTKIVCLQNDHDNDIFNGQIAVIKEIHSKDQEFFSADIVAGDRNIRGINIWNGGFEGKNPGYHDRKNYNIFDYGYAITCHKAQGSEFDKVVVMADWPGDQKKFLYTAITRARKQCRIYF